MNVEVSNHMQALEADQIKELDKKFKASQSTDSKKSQPKIKSKTST